MRPALKRTGTFAAFALAALAAAFGVTPSAAGRPKQGQPMLRLQSSAFDANHEIPTRYTCEGEDISPPLSWEGAPPGTESLALIVDDPDAPDPAAPRRTWVHWLVYNLPPTTQSLDASASLPPGALEGVNDFQKTSYGGPCPPIGRHRYFFKLYALDEKLSLMRPNKAQLVEAMQGHVLAQTELIGTYQKKQTK